MGVVSVWPLCQGVVVLPVNGQHCLQSFISQNNVELVDIM